MEKASIKIAKERTKRRENEIIGKLKGNSTNI